MTARKSRTVPLRVAIVFMVAGFAVIGGVSWFAGGQHSTLSLFPFVLLAVGLGLGLVAAGAVLYAGERRRRQLSRTEDALASVLVAAARLSSSRRS